MHITPVTNFNVQIDEFYINKLLSLKLIKGVSLLQTFGRSYTPCVYFTKKLCAAEIVSIWRLKRNSISPTFIGLKLSTVY